MKKIITFLLCAVLCLGPATGASASGEASGADSRTIKVIVIGSSAAAKAADGAASGELPLEAVGVVEFSGEEYVPLDDLIIALLLGNR